MKKILFVLLCVVLNSSAFAQSDTIYFTQSDTLKMFVPKSEGVVVGYEKMDAVMCMMPVDVCDTLTSVDNFAIVKSTKSGELIFEMGEVGINIAAKTGASKPRLRFGLGFSRFELGYSLLSSPDYSSYAAEDGDFLNLWTGKSTHVGFRFVSFSVESRNRKMVFQTGIQVMWDNYTFSDNITLRRIDGMIEPVRLDENYKKSKMTVTSLGIPLQLSFQPVKRLYVSAQVFGELVVSSYTKYKHPKIKERLSGLNNLRCGVGMTVSFHKIGIYGKYTISRLFDKGAGPETHPYSLGLYLGF